MVCTFGDYVTAFIWGAGIASTILTAAALYLRARKVRKAA